jgi:hypothetical protein
MICSSFTVVDDDSDHDMNGIEECLYSRECGSMIRNECY